jgi:hypothetical protein
MKCVGRMDGNTRPKQKYVDTTVFWNIVMPVLGLVILLFIIFVAFSMPSWATTCKSDLFPVRQLAQRLNTNTGPN